MVNYDLVWIIVNNKINSTHCSCVFEFCVFMYYFLGALVYVDVIFKSFRLTLAETTSIESAIVCNN